MRRAHDTSSAGARGAARKHRAPARRVARAAGIVRAANGHRVDGRVAVELLVGAAAEIDLQRLRDAFGLPRTVDERRRDLMHAGRHRRAHLEARVGGVHVELVFGLADDLAVPRQRSRRALGFAADGEALERAPSRRSSSCCGLPMPTM